MQNELQCTNCLLQIVFTDKYQDFSTNYQIHKNVAALIMVMSVNIMSAGYVGHIDDGICRITSSRNIYDIVAC